MTTLIDPSSRGIRTKDNQHFTNCSACKLGVYRHQPWQWSRQPLGIVHSGCVGGR